MANYQLNIAGAVQIATALLRARLFGKRTPLFTGWNLTFRCNLRCGYCGVDQLDYEELDTQAINDHLTELYKLGTRWVTFSGGEPLLRRDIPEIIAHARNLGIHVFISSNGRFVPKYIETLKQVDKVTISLDGDEACHDAIRGKGAYRRALTAIDCCHEQGIPVSLLCVLSRQNLAHWRGVLDVAHDKKIWAMFQPATAWLEAVNNVPNPEAADPPAYRKAVEQLIRLKRDGAPVANSVAGMKHLIQWPEPADIPCDAGVLSCTLEPDGRVVACDFDIDTFHIEQGAPAGTMADRFRESARSGPCCRSCWCAPVVELNLMASFRPNALLNILRMEFLPYPEWRRAPVDKAECLDPRAEEQLEHVPARERY